MKIVKAGYEHMPKENTMPYRFIEEIGRTCYKSEDRITEDSAVKFVQNLVKNGHLAMLEHWWVHIAFHGGREPYDFDFKMVEELKGSSQYIRLTEIGHNFYLSAPLRVFLEGSTFSIHTITEEVVAESFPELFPNDGRFWGGRYCKRYRVLPEAEFCTELKGKMNKRWYPEEKKREILMEHRTHTVKFICDRGVSHELVRHRPCSFAQESTRYCNYNSGKFGGEITVVEPFFFHDRTVEYMYWESACKEAETMYSALIGQGAAPQEARSILPNSLKTEIVMTANETEWQHIVNLRSKGTTGKPHPQMKEIMDPWYEKLKVISDGRIQ